MRKQEDKIEKTLEVRMDLELDAYSTQVDERNKEFKKRLKNNYSI